MQKIGRILIRFDVIFLMLSSVAWVYAQQGALGYYVTLADKNDPQEARTFADAMIQVGYSARVVPDPSGNGTQHVVIGPYATQDQADQVRAGFVASGYHLPPQTITTLQQQNVAEFEASAVKTMHANTDEFERQEEERVLQQTRRSAAAAREAELSRETAAAQETDSSGPTNILEALGLQNSANDQSPQQSSDPIQDALNRNLRNLQAVGANVRPQTTKAYTSTLNNGDMRKETIVTDASGSHITVQCFAPGQTEPYKVWTDSGPSEFFMNTPPCTRPASTSSAGNGTGTAKPPVPAKPAPVPVQLTVAANSSLCPADGWIMHQTGDVSVGQQCTPGQTVNGGSSGTGSSSGGRNTISSSGGLSGAGSGSGSGSSGSPGNDDNARWAYDAPLNNCVAESYGHETPTGDYVRFANNCSDQVKLIFVASPKIYGLIYIGGGSHDVYYASQSDVTAAGGMSIYACPAGDNAVDVAGNIIGREKVAQFRCRHLKQ